MTKLIELPGGGGNDETVEKEFSECIEGMRLLVAKHRIKGFALVTVFGDRTTSRGYSTAEGYDEVLLGAMGRLQHSLTAEIEEEKT